ncbi:hypothetical protein Vi05172_g12378 [Venturia inaequalis]|nr:hypothetical protein Vi05172_g12378 [Venturia inaequalis]
MQVFISDGASARQSMALDVNALSVCSNTETDGSRASIVAVSMTAGAGTDKSGWMTQDLD